MASVTYDHVTKRFGDVIAGNDLDLTSAKLTAQPVEGRIGLTELMGNEIWLYVNSGEHNFMARVDPRSTISAREQAFVVFNMNTMHLFDPDTERTIQ